MALELDAAQQLVAAPKARILLIDDSRFIRLLFTSIFEDLGYEVAAAADGPEGILMAADRPFDVVVVDGVLPTTDGREVCRHLASLPGEKPILLLFTASKSHFQDRYMASQDGIDGYLQKDASGEALVARMEQLLAVRATARAQHSA